MIPVAWYATFYHIIISCLILHLCIQLYGRNSRLLGKEKINHAWCNILLLTVILFIGLRNPYASHIYFGDTGAYTRMFESIRSPFAEAHKDFGFFYFAKFSSFIPNVQMFYLLCAFLYVFPVYVTFKKWFAHFTLFALMIYIAAMSFWAFGINGVRNGLAVSFFIFALGNINKKGLMALFLLLSISMHKSMLLPIVIYFVSYFIKKPRWAIVIWFLSIIFCLAAGRQILLWLETTNFAGLIDDPRTSVYSIDSWADDEVVERIRFRLDFILYSAVAVFLGWFYVVKKRFQDKFYSRLLNTYILTNAAWIAFFMYTAFTNRYAYLSWCIMPIVMVYPLLKTQLVKNQYRFISLLILGNLVFTLIMFFG